MHGSLLSVVAAASCCSRSAAAECFGTLLPKAGPKRRSSLIARSCNSADAERPLGVSTFLQPAMVAPVSMHQATQPSIKPSLYCTKAMPEREKHGAVVAPLKERARAGKDIGEHAKKEVKDVKDWGTTMRMISALEGFKYKRIATATAIVGLP